MQYAYPSGTPALPAVTNHALLRLQKTLNQGGWELEYLDLDLTREKPTLNLKIMRSNGLWLLATIDSLGRCNIETFQRTRTLGVDRAYGKYKPPQSLQIDDQFLGRTPHSGPRALLRYLTGYLVANAVHPLALSDVRAAWAGVMSTPTRLAASAALAA